MKIHPRSYSQLQPEDRLGGLKPEGHFSKPALDHHLSRALRQDAAA